MCASEPTKSHEPPFPSTLKEYPADTPLIKSVCVTTMLVVNENAAQRLRALRLPVKLFSGDNVKDSRLSCIWLSLEHISIGVYGGSPRRPQEDSLTLFFSYSLTIRGFDLIFLQRISY